VGTLHSQMRDAVNWLKGAPPVDLAARAKADGAK